MAKPRRRGLAIRKAARALRDSSGVSAIEFAIVAGLFFTIVFGIIIYGDYFACDLLIAHIAEESARASLAGLDDSERESLALARANTLKTSYSGLLDASVLTVTAGPSATTGVFSVSVSYVNDFLGLGGLSAFVPLPPKTQTAQFEVSNGGY
jgi:Flp pilus assembly protein TadG